MRPHRRFIPMGCAVLLAAALHVPGHGEPWGTVAGIERSDRLAEGFKLVSARPVAPARVTASPRNSLHDASDPDTVWIGHVMTATGLPGQPEGWGPFKVGRGPYQPGVSPNGIWDWDSFQPWETDSLMGWWPIRRAYSLTGGLVRLDDQRPWWALDYGNQANYVINQGSSNARTFGVVGVWHRDPGSTAGAAMAWTPIEGAYSAWCGLRAHGDLTVMDPITGNPLNQSVLQFNGENGTGASGTSKNFPGYGKQWDQLLYRDIHVPGGSPSLTIRFRFATRMSRSRNLDPATRTGWFDKDPLSFQPGNLISSTAAGSQGAPADSFMVYVGVPVNDASCWYSNGIIAAVRDPLRRWFSEVVRVNEPGVPYLQLLSVAGDVPAQPTDPTPTYVGQISGSQLAALLAHAPDNRLRLVFRVKTNGAYDDQDAGETGYSSLTRGAAIIDNVEYAIDGQSFGMLGDFESPASIDNAPGTPALSAWKSTGKPPAIYFHRHSIEELIYSDVCGPPGSERRTCSMSGNVISAGDHDQGEIAGGLEGAERERMDGMVSPTINLCSPGPGAYNAMGIDSEIADATDDYFLAYEIYTGVTNTVWQGNTWTYGFQSYPALQSNGQPCWGELRFPRFQLFNPNRECLRDLAPARQYGLIRTSNPSGIPDSIRVFLGKNQQCFRFGLGASCSPDDGLYFDNVAVGFVDDPEEPLLSKRSITVQPWHWLNDCFPATDNPALVGTPAFDTCAALIKTGLNTAAQSVSTQRPNVPGDSMAVEAYGPDTRVDIVFRIAPGPGNYVVPGNRGSGLRRVPTSATPITHGDPTNFWSSYMADNGAFGTYGTGSGGPGHGGQWNPDLWNSARCDTAESSLFPVSARGNLAGLEAGVYSATLHESDPRFVPLGIPRHRCFLNDTLGPVNTTNVVCDQVPPWAFQRPGTGWNGEAMTREFTKIIPDGHLTPGSHVEYFFRRSRASDPLVFATVPDTQRVFPQKAEGSWDGHRWQQFNVLPDRWKDPQYGGIGNASMLVIDWGDRRGDQRAWVSIADSIGATQSSKFGAGTGWHASGDANYDDVIVGSDPSIAVYPNLGQPGTSWDLYNVKAGESLITTAGAIGNRLAAPAGGHLFGKVSRQGPSLQMLEAYYRTILLLSGDLSVDILGGFPDRSDGDIALLENHLNAGTSQEPRGLHLIGSGLATALRNQGLTEQSDFLEQSLGARWRDWHYMLLTYNLESPIAAQTLPPLHQAPLLLDNHCWGDNPDVLEVNESVPGATAIVNLPSGGAQSPVVGSVLRPFHQYLNPFVTQIDGWSLSSMPANYAPAPAPAAMPRTRGDELLTESYRNRSTYMANVYSNQFDGIGGFDPPDPVSVGLPDPIRSVPFQRFVRFDSPNPWRAGPARIRFGIERTGPVRATIHDVAGRRVAVLADETFTGGVEHELRWSGKDASGQRARPGIYFMRFASPGFEVARRVIMLR